MSVSGRRGRQEVCHTSPSGVEVGARRSTKDPPGGPQTFVSVPFIPGTS